VIICSWLEKKKKLRGCQNRIFINSEWAIGTSLPAAQQAGAGLGAGMRRANI